MSLREDSDFIFNIIHCHVAFAGFGLLSSAGIDTRKIL